MKVEILTSGDYPYGGAPGNFVRVLTEGLSENGCSWNVTKYLGSIKGCDNTKSSKNFLFRSNSGGKITKSFKEVARLIYLPFWILTIKKKNVDAIVLYSIDRMHVAAIICLFCKILSIKCVRIVTELYDSSNMDLLHKILNALETIQIELFDRFMDGIVVLSKSLKDYAVHHGVAEKNIIILRHFIKIGTFIPAETKRNRFSFVYTGTPTIQNGVYDLIDAFNIVERNHDCELIIIANNDVLFERKIKEINSKNIKVEFNLNVQEINDRLRKCTVGVNPRRIGIEANTGFPTKLCEYMAIGLPVISSKIGAPLECLNDFENVIYYQPNDVSDLASKMIFLVENSKVCETISRNSYAWAGSNLDYIKNARLLVNFISNV